MVLFRNRNCFNWHNLWSVYEVLYEEMGIIYNLKMHDGITLTNMINKNLPLLH